MRDPDEVVVVSETRYHSILRDESGYAVWEVTTDAEAPIATFPLTDEGLDGAFELIATLAWRHRGDWMLRGAAWIVAGFGIAWLALVAITTMIGIIGLVRPAVVAGAADRLTSLLYAVPSLPTAFLVAIGIYVILWTQMRSRRGRD